MAEDIGSLYVRLGLDISELETGFVAVGRTVNENVRRLNRESDLIRLRSEVEITGLDEAADAERILQIRQESLNRQMEIQRDRVRILTAELQNLTQAHGDEAVITQRAAIRLERERLALAQLERDLRGLNNTSEETNSLFDELSDMLPSMPTKLQAIGIAAGLVASGFGSAAAAVKELMEDFRELQTQSYELNLPVNDTKKLLRELKLAGGDIGDFEGYIRGITDAYVKGEYDDPEFIALRRYGAEIVDATGKLKNFADISDEVFKAWEKADAEGNGIEFLQLTGGESGIRDAIQLFMRLKEAKEDAAKIYDANLDADQLHELDRAFALVEEQAKELKDAIGNIFVPAAQMAAEKLFNTLHDGTEWLVENKDAIQKWGFIAEEVFSTIADKVKEGYHTVGEFIEEALKPKNTAGNEKVDKMMSGLDWRYGSAQKPYGVDKMTKGITEATESYGIFNDAVERAKEKQKEFNDAVEETAEDLDKLDEELEDASGNPLSQYGWQRVQQFRAELDELRAELDNWGNDYKTALAQLDLWRDQELTQKNYASNEERLAIKELYAAKLDQIEQERADKIAEIRKSVDTEFKTSLENRLDKIEEEKEAWISAGMEEAEASELAQRQIAKAYEDAAAKAQEYFKNAAEIEYSLTHTAFEKQLRDIELWKEAQQEKAETAEEVAGIIKNAAAKEAEAFENAVDRIKGKLQTLDDKIFEIDHSQYENDLRKLQQEYIRTAEDLQKEGVFDEVTKARLDYLYKRKKENLDKRAQESIKTEGDYTKPPEGTMQRAGNGIMVIGGDQIIDDGLKQSQQQVIGLMTDENRIRSTLMQNLDAETKTLVERVQAEKELTDAQKLLTQSAEQAASGYEVIEGDKVVTMPQVAMPQIPTSGFELIEGDQIVAGLQQFDDALQQSTEELEQFDPMKELADKQAALSESTEEVTTAQKTLAEAVNQFPAEYLKNLADGAKAVSDTQSWLTNSTLELIDAQSNLRDALNNLQDIKTSPLQENQLPTDGFQTLSTSTKNLADAQDLVARRTRELEPLQVSRQQTPKSDLNLGFDMDTAGTVLGLGALIAGIGGAPITAPIVAGITALSALGGLAKGTYDATTEAREQNGDRLQSNKPDSALQELITTLNNIDEKVQGILAEMQSGIEAPEQVTSADVDLTDIIKPLTDIDETIKNVLTSMQTEPTLDSLKEVLGELSNIKGTVQEVLQSAKTIATNQGTQISFKPLEIPLNKIEYVVEKIPVSFTQITGLIEKIVSAINDREPPQVNVSPNLDIDLGGAYVFDNAMKQSLVDDITNKIVTAIKDAVQQATKTSNIGCYGI